MKKLLTLSVAALAVAGIVGVGTMNASAVNRQGNATGVRGGMGQGNGNGYQSSLESRAKVFGMTADELKKALETQTMSQIAVERGMPEETFRAKMTEAAKARWESRGISSDEIAKRLADRDARHTANAADHTFGSGEGNHQGGYRNNR